MGRYKTCLEKGMANALTNEGIEFVDEFPIRSKYGYIVDFIILPRELNIIVECDGEKWHPLGNGHDRRRDGFLKHIGWTIMRFRGEQIENDIHSCIASIKEIIKLKGGKLR